MLSCLGTVFLAMATLQPQAAGPAPAAIDSRGDAAASPYAAWELGPPADPDFFPIGVWAQDPRLAERYAELGVNTFVGLWRGPTEEQLAVLEEAGMKLVCAMNEEARALLEDPTIVAWMQADEPDNAVRRQDGSVAPRFTPQQCRRRYQQLREIDPRRPVWMNLGQGVANDGWKGRGARRSDYPEYARACDILSFDVYPVAGLRRDDGEDFLWYVAKGLRRLRRWGGDERIVWNFLECTAIQDERRKPTPEQVRSEVWMSLIHGSRGIVWFCHSFVPDTRPAALLEDEEMARTVGELNREILALAPVLNAPPAEGRLVVESGSSRVPVAATAREHEGVLHVFAVGMRNDATRARFRLLGVPEGARVVVPAEHRALALDEEGGFEDDFAPYEVHRYRIDLER